MSCNFHVGQKVVCINDDKSASLRLGCVYTVVGLLDRMLPTCLGTTEYGVALLEAKPNELHIGFASSRFRPVVERKTDISIFKAMLNPSKQRISA